MMPARHNLTRRALLGAGVGACAAGDMCSRRVAIWEAGAGAAGGGDVQVPAALHRRWHRALAAYRRAEARLEALRRHIDGLPPEQRAFPPASRSRTGMTISKAPASRGCAGCPRPISPRSRSNWSSPSTTRHGSSPPPKPPSPPSSPTPAALPAAAELSLRRRQVDPHPLLLLPRVGAEMPVAADVAEPQIVDRPGAAVASRREVLDRGGLAAIRRSVEAHRLVAPPAIVAVQRAQHLCLHLAAAMPADPPGRKAPLDRLPAHARQPLSRALQIG